MIQTVFSNNNGVFNKGVRLITRGRVGHVALYNDKTGMVLESTWGGGGVKPISIDNFIKRSSEYAIAYTNSPESVWESAESQIGKKYDKSAIFGIGLNRDWQNPIDWYCSEYWAWCHVVNGIHYFRDDVNFIFPQHVYMVLRCKMVWVKK
jgi:hypothetical protein